MFKLPIIFVFFFCFCVSGLIAQEPAKDTIILMNGNIVVEKVLDTLLGAVSIRNVKKQGRLIHYEYDELFCVHYSKGFKDYYYTQDTLKGNWFTRDETFMFTKGEADARKGFRGNGAFITAGVFGLLGGASGTFLVRFYLMDLWGLAELLK